MDVATIAQRMGEWLATCLECVPGKREFNKGRILLKVVFSREDVLAAYHEFREGLEAGRAVSCLFIDGLAGETAARPLSSVEQMLRLAELMSSLTQQKPESLIHGGQLGLKLRLRCPVTDQSLLFDDFDCVAFYPHAADINESIYDPLMAAPLPCAHLNSDVYAFSQFVRDMSLVKKGKEVHQLQSTRDRHEVYALASRNWQRISRKTILNYTEITDTTRCPVELSRDETQWLAFHQDPAFAETQKSEYLHEMPVLYTPRIIERWEQFFDGGELPLTSGVTLPGSKC